MKTLKVLYILAVPTALAVLVAWEGARIRARGYQLQDLQRRIEQERIRRQKYKAQINKLKSPGRILHLVRKHRLPLRSGPKVQPEQEKKIDTRKKERAVVMAEEAEDDESE